MVQGKPIVIDHGVWETRIGWGGEVDPSYIYPTTVAKCRSAGTERSIVAVGIDDIGLSAKITAHPAATKFWRESSPGQVVVGVPRSSYDPSNSILVHPEYLEYELDYAFTKLGISQSECVPHSVFMTETICNPPASRQVSTELLFECYGVPAVTYGIDALCSLYQNCDGHLESSLVVTSSHGTSHVLPVLNGSWVTRHSVRLPIGGMHAADFLSKSLRLKYPDVQLNLAAEDAQSILSEQCFVAKDYKQELRAIENRESLGSLDRIIQLGDNEGTTGHDKESDLQERAVARREAQRTRMKERIEKMREEKLAAHEKKLSYFESLLKNFESQSSEKEKSKQLAVAGFDDIDSVVQRIAELHSSITKIRNKILGIETEPELKETPTFPLADKPDSELNDDERKEKRRQRLMKAGWVAREKIRLQKERLRDEERRKEEADEAYRLSRPQEWLLSVRKKRSEIMERRKMRLKKDKTAVGGRRIDTTADTMRLKTISTLASDNLKVSDGMTKKKRRAGEDDDNFGANDEDWAVYRELSSAVRVDDEDEEAEEAEQKELDHYESQLAKYDPEYLSAEEMELSERKNSLYYRLLYGPIGYERESPAPDVIPPIHLNVERIRIPEILFQPSIVGIDRAGLSEVAQMALQRFSPLEQQRMMQNVFITGTHTLYPGFARRIESDLRMILPVNTAMTVRRAVDPRLDAWRGASLWASRANNNSYISRAMYEEFGAEYLKEHELSNAVHADGKEH